MASIRKREWTYKGETKWKWVCEYTDLGGARRRETFDRREEAKDFKLKIELELKQGTHTADSQSITVAEACERHLERCEARNKSDQRMARATLRQRRYFVPKHITPYIGALKLTKLTSPLIQRWINDLRYHETDPRSVFVLRTVAMILRRAIAEAQLEGRVAHNVMIDNPPDIGRMSHDEVAIPTKAQANAIMLAAEGRNRLIIRLACFTGMRLGELLGLSWAQIDFAKREIRVNRQVDRDGHVSRVKTKAGMRTVPVPPRLIEELEAWCRDKPPGPKGFVFPTSNGGPILQPDWQSHMWPAILRRAGLSDKGGERVKTHHLRHFAASLLIEQGLPPKRIQQLMGHASIQMTFDKYGHLFPDGDQVARASASIESQFSGEAERDKKATTAA